MKSRRPVNSDVVRHFVSSMDHMKRTLAYLLVASLAFAVGWLAHELRHANYRHSETEVAITRTSVCDLQSEPALYQGKVVSVRGTLTGDRSGAVFLRTTSCSSDKSLSIVPIYVADDRLFSPLPAWAGYASFCGNDSYASAVDGLSADAVVVAFFDGTQLIPRSVLQMSVPSKQR